MNLLQTRHRRLTDATPGWSDPFSSHSVLLRGAKGGINSFFQKMSKIQHFLDKNWVLSLRKIFLSSFGWFLDIPVGPGASKRHFLKNPVLTLGDLFSTVWTVSAFGYSPKQIYLGMKTLPLLLYTFQPHWSTFLAQFVTQGQQGGGGAVIGFLWKFTFSSPKSSFIIKKIIFKNFWLVFGYSSGPI